MKEGNIRALGFRVSWCNSALRVAVAMTVT